jgi:hypothetical protein
MAVLQDVRPFKAVGQHEGLVVEEDEGLAVANDAPRVEDDGARAEFDHEL